MLSSWWFDRALRTLVLSHLPRSLGEAALGTPLPCPISPPVLPTHSTSPPPFCGPQASPLPPVTISSQATAACAVVPSPGPHCRADLLPRALSGFDFFSCLCFTSHQPWTTRVSPGKVSLGGLRGRLSWRWDPSCPLIPLAKTAPL